jgi:biopolymer transport protein ExbD
MSVFKKKKSGEVPAVSTASLPDIVFMLLFFFMVSTVMRDTELIVENKLPKANQTSKLGKKDRVMTIYIGKPHQRYRQRYGSGELIQLGDRISQPSEILEFVRNERAQRPPEIQPAMIAALKVDENSKMGLVTEVKQKLREAEQYKVNYTTTQGSVFD